jgi:murein DD-endopeptidase MepM/ murein hydrolase activator NlpD
MDAVHVYCTPAYRLVQGLQGKMRAVVRSSLFAALLLCACQTTTPAVVHSVYRRPGNPAKEYCAGAWSIHVEQTQRAARFLGANACHVPLFMELSFPRLQNANASQPLPVRQSLPPNSERELLSLEPIDPSKAWPFEWKVSAFVGSSPPLPEPDYRYAFPFDGSQPRRLIQGVDGKLTHQGLHRFAFDFEMPIGTPVLAARDGIVLRVADGFPAGPFEEKYRDRSNGVFALHPDGTIGDDGHLSAGIPVKEGMRVYGPYPGGLGSTDRNPV